MRAVDGRSDTSWGISVMNLFAYGTLMWPEILAGVIGRNAEGRPAVLESVRRMRVRGQFYPALIPGSGAVEGVLYKNLTGAEIAALDRFEGPEYDRRSVTVCCDGTALEAETYFTSEAGKTLLEEAGWTPDDLPPEQLEQFRTSYKGWR